MVTDEATLIGDTFLMLPTDAFPATAKIIITTNCGEREFLLKDIVDAKPHAWESGEYINYNITVSNENYQFTATPLEWTDSPVNVIFDKQYYLRLSQNKVLTARNAATVNIEVKKRTMMRIRIRGIRLVCCWMIAAWRRGQRFI